MLAVPLLSLPPARVAGTDDEIAAIPVEQSAVQDRVVGVQVDVGALLHHPVLVVAQEQVLAPLVEEPALDPLATADALGGQ